MHKLLLAALAYAAVYHYGYVAYINPIFEYAHYTYQAPSIGRLVVTYVLTVAPVIARPASRAPATFGVALVYALCYVPGEMTLLFTWERSAAELFAVQALLAASMALLLWGSRFGVRRGAPLRTAHRLGPVVGALALASLVLLVATHHQHMRLVSFADVYDLRFDTNEIETGVVGAYLLSWLSYCLLPYYFTRGILLRRPIDIGFGAFGCLLIYASTGSKAAILMPAIVFGLHLLIGSGREFLLRLLLLLAAAIALIVQFLPDDGPLLWIKSILLVRMLGSSGWATSVYYDYFTTNGHTFYSHIGPVNALTQSYPYGELSLGQVIGVQYSGSEQANFNANFWASDAFAALGLAGVPVVTVVLIGVFWAINRVASGFSTRFVVLWLTGFWLAMLNVPLTTALLSGGGALTLTLLWSVRRRRLPRAAPPGERPAAVQPFPQ